MHLKSYPKLMHSELRLEAAGGHMSSQQSGVFVSQHGMLLKSCRGRSSSASSINSRFPLSIISTNMLHGGTTANRVCSSVTSLQLKLSHSAALQVVPQPAGCENDRCSPYQTATEDADAPLDIWAVIKPGHVREKIALFASEGEPTEAGERTSAGTCDRTPPPCTNNTGMSGLTRAVKAKGSWEDNCSAKRRRRSGGNQNRLQVQTTHKPSPWHSDLTRQREGRAPTDAEEDEQKVSVVEMVAFLEQRVGEQQKDCKPLLTLQRSSTTITLSRTLSLEIGEGSEVSGEELESVRVSDRVAKLESECLRRRTEGTLSLSRSNSLRRTVGRVLLTAGAQSCAPSCLASPVTSSVTSSPLSIRLSETRGEDKPAPSPVLTETQQPVGDRGHGDAPPQQEGVEPLPGFLFLSVSSNIGLDSTPPTKDLEPHPRPSRHAAGSGSLSEKTADRGQESDAAVSVHVDRRVSASQDFLDMRQRLQQLLEPQPYLAVLPHHLLVKIFLLLPTQSLAALKCTCHYFKFVIENYGVRPADSLWVSDPRYRDDPCKQCKRKYGRGDVSLCRWHHKPYCQALPYGPGYWMCCHGAHRDAPGCNVGLHDNRWVPAFHSVNVPIYRMSHDDK